MGKRLGLSGDGCMSSSSPSKRVPRGAGQHSQRNRVQGAQFEAAFVHRAGICGLWPIKQQLTFRYLGGGKIRPMRSELDFALVNRNGQVGYFDCKSFEGDSFARSAMNPAQVQRAMGYNAWSVPAGFVVWFRSVNEVAYFSGTRIARSARGCGFSVHDGTLLGPLESFVLRPLLQPDACV